jgi:peroxin-3
MISATTRFLKKHQKKIFITLGITGGAYLIGKWATWKFVEMQERNAAERTAKKKFVF